MFAKGLRNRGWIIFSFAIRVEVLRQEDSLMTRGSLMARGEFYNGEDLTISGFAIVCCLEGDLQIWKSVTISKEFYNKWGRLT